MILLKNSLLDGQASFEQGVDTYRTPARVPRNQLTLSINNTSRNDYLSQRPGWEKVDLVFADSYGVPDATLRSEFETGLFQGWSGYEPDTGTSHLVFSISGKLFRVNALTDKSVMKFTLPGTNPHNRPQAWFKQAEQFLIWQDGQSVPLIYDGATIRESDVHGHGGTDANGVALKEVPVGTVMEYVNGRLWVALPDGRSFVAGDMVYGPTGTAAYNRRDSFLRFTENQYLNGGQPFAVPANMGPIRAMKAVANLDTSLGQGPLQVFTPNGCFSVNVPLIRDAWFTVTNPIATVSLLDDGALSANSAVLVNGDVWYRASDGVRSFLIARRDFGTWGNRSMSYEVIRHLKDDDRNLLQYCSAALFDNRLLVTCSPFRSAFHGVYHRGLVVLDFIPLTSLGGSQPPNWDGLWTGLDILQIGTVESEGVRHCFAATLAAADSNGVRKIELWKLTLDSGHDTNGTTQTRISRIIESPRFDFSPGTSNRLELKELEAADLWVDKVSGTVDFRLFYRPDEYPCWFEWKHWQICAKTQRCASDGIAGCQQAMNLKPQFRARMGSLRPPENLLEFINLPARIGYTFQYRLEIVGEAELTAIRLLANRLVEQTFGAGLPEDAVCEELICCDEDNWATESTTDTGDTDDEPDGGNSGSAGPPISGSAGPDTGSAGTGGNEIDDDSNSFPAGGYPVTNGWTSGWTGFVLSDYGINKTSANPNDDLTHDITSFWTKLMETHWNDLGPPAFTERIYYWDYVDSHTTFYGDIVAKVAQGDWDNYDGLPQIELTNFWRLNIAWR